MAELIWEVGKWRVLYRDWYWLEQQVSTDSLGVKIWERVDKISYSNMTDLAHAIAKTAGDVERLRGQLAESTK